MGTSPSHTQHAPLTAHLLGRVRLAVGERAIPDATWPRRSSRSLLLLLLATPGHRLPRDRVLDLLWPETAPAAALSALYVALHGLRRTLEPGLRTGRDSAYVEAAGEIVGLRPHAGLWVDTTAFEAALSGAEALPPTERPAALRQALALYGGELLAEEPYADWPAARREWLRQGWRRATLALAELEEQAGRPLTAVAEIERLLAADPTDEIALRALLRALAAAGQPDVALRQYERGVRTLQDLLGVEPSAETQALAAELRTIAPSAALPRSASAGRFDNLPAPPNPLVGRAREVEALQDLLWDPDLRLITVTGTGGIGKSRLALEVARQMVGEFADGACFVPLAAIADPGLVVPTIAHTLGVDETGSRTIAELVRAALRDRELLLVLDNFEQVLDAAPEVADLLAACPRLKVLVTSREPLHLRAEHELPAPPLAVPPLDRDAASRLTAAAAARYEAVALFSQRARAVNPAFALGDDNAATVAALCARLDGLPLAIELAAARSRRLDPTELLAGLSDRLALLAAGYRDLPPRQRTMRDAIGWSYDLLDPAEQAIFRHLAVFAGGFALDAVERVLSHPEGTRSSVLSEHAAPGSALSTQHSALDLLGSLVDKSLLRQEEGPDGRPRYEMLETIREFARERLEDGGEAEAARRRHAEHFLEVAEAADAALWQPVRGPEQEVWLDRLEAEHDNLRSSLGWAARHAGELGLSLAAALLVFWDEHGHVSEGRRWLEQALARCKGAAPQLRAKALHGVSLLALGQGDCVGCAASGEPSIALYRALGDREGVGRTLSVLAAAAYRLGELERAIALGEEAATLARELGHTRGLTITLSDLGLFTAHRRGDERRAASLVEEALALAREHGDRSGAGYALLRLGRVVRRRGDGAAAAPLLCESLALYRDHGEMPAVLACLDELALLAEASGQPERAGRLFGAAEGLREAIGASLPPPERADYEQATARLRDAVGDPVFAAAWETGRALPLPRAIAEALAVADDLA